MKKAAIILVVVCLLTAVFVWFRFHQTQGVSVPPDLPTREETINLIGERGELGLRRKINAPLIATYEKMLLQYPESLDLKRKLAQVYEEVGETEKAQKLRDEIDKKAPPP